MRFTPFPSSPDFDIIVKQLGTLSLAPTVPCSSLRPHEQGILFESRYVKLQGEGQILTHLTMAHVSLHGNCTVTDNLVRR